RGVIATPIWPAFVDLRVVTEAWDEAAAGFDPLRMDGDAPRYNYPRLWLLGGKLGGRTEDARWLGVVVAGLFLGAVWAVMRRAPGWTRLLGAGLVASPAIALGLERGNSDLLVFALATPALLDAASRHGGWRAVWPPWLVALAGGLKLFPILIMPACLIRAGRATWISAIAGLVVFGAYLVATRVDVAAVLAKTERGKEESYGLALAAENLAGAAFEAGTPEAATGHPLALAIAAGLTLAAAGAACWPKVRRALMGDGKAAPDAAVRLFVGGATIFLVTFLFEQSWAYRLVFLIWTLPLLGHELYHGSWSRRILGGVTLALIGLICWGVAGTSADGVTSAHAACFALVFFLVLVGGLAVGVEANATAGPDVFSHRIVLAGVGILAVGGMLVAASGRVTLSAGDSAAAWKLLLRGKAEAADGRVGDATASFEAALRLAPDHADVHTQLGAVLWQAGRSPEALAHLERALALQPRAIGARNILAGVRRQQRRWDEAIAGYRESLAIRPRHVGTLNDLGLACLESGRADQAHGWLEQARALAPDHAATERNLGIVASARGRTDEAAAHFERALLLRPDYADAELQWGFALARARRLPEALEHFRRAVALAPDSGQAHFVLAMAFRELGRTAEGEPHYREALRLEPSLAPR
ncbi:MAG TPA: tetratricopeptide repeat protein, partial [Lacunisphaera sp.]|nr:tetratricopeptide repeat protein [Lacunisphaera sp.]